MYRYHQGKTQIIGALLILITLLSTCKKTTEKVLVKRQGDKPAVTGIARLGIKMLKSKTLDAVQVKRITQKLYERLLSIKGKNYIAFKEHDRSHLEVNHSLTGSVNKISPGYSISILVSNRLNGNTVYKRSSRVNEEIELDYILNDIAERVVEKLW